VYEQKRERGEKRRPGIGDGEALLHVTPCGATELQKTTRQPKKSPWPCTCDSLQTHTHTLSLSIGGEEKQYVTVQREREREDDALQY
jgi:hypothetical protein